MKIAVYAIAKNEAKNAKRFYASAKEADLVIVTDTGSTDGTPNLLRQLGAIVHEAKVSPWRFDAARNIALSNIPDDVDICLSLDLDEELSPGWRDELEELCQNQNGITQISPKWVFSWQDEEKTIPGVVANPPRIHARHGYEWRGEVHEMPYPIDEEKSQAMYTDKIVGYHKGNDSSYIPMLTKILEKDPDNLTRRLQRAYDYFNTGQYEKSLVDYQIYLAKGQEEEERNRSCAEIEVAKCMKRTDKPVKEILKALLRAVAEDPGCREAWVYLAEAWYSLGNFPSAYGAAMTALGIKNREIARAYEEICWGDLPKQIASSAFCRISERGGN